MLVSVVICAKNEEKYIETCLKCLKGQTIKPEIIVIDGHSNDKTKKIAGRYTKLVFLDNKKGIADARNMGWKKAKGDIVAYCDADSRPPKDWVEKIAKFMDKNMCIFGPIVPYDSGTKVRLSLKMWGDWFLHLASAMRYPCICAANVAFKKDVLKRYPFRLNLIEDFDVGNRIRHVGKVRFFSELAMPISGRRFFKSFHRMAFKYYFLNFIKLKMGKKLKVKYW